jgi:hypothetical protein
MTLEEAIWDVLRIGRYTYVANGVIYPVKT